MDDMNFKYVSHQLDKNEAALKLRYMQSTLISVFLYAIFSGILTLRYKLQITLAG
jgi:hypothetical protein